MVRRILALFHRELSGVHQAAFLLATATIASSILGLLRDRLLAARFGAGTELDIYFAAFRIPDFLYALSLFFVASTAIIPIFLERAAESTDTGRALLSTLFTAFVLFMLVLLGVIFFFMPLLMPFLVPGFEEASTAQVIALSRILLLSPLLLGLSNLLSSILQSYRRFFVYALSPLLYNVGIIGGILVLLPRYGLPGLAWGIVAGAVLHALVQVPSLMRLGFVPRFTVRFSSDFWRVIRLSIPRTLGLSAAQLSFMAVTAIASTLGAGAIAVFQLSYNIQSIPLAVIGLSYSVAAFPTMAELIQKKERRIFFEHLASATRHIIFWTLPLAVLFVVLRAQIVRSVLGAGAFGWVDTRLTAAALALFALGIVAQSLAALFVRAFYAVGRTAVPIGVNIFSMVVTIGAAFFFVDALETFPGLAYMFGKLLRVADVPQIAVLGLPLAFAFGGILNAILLALGFTRVEGEFRNHRLMVSLGEIAAASLLTGAVSYAALNVLSYVFNLNTFTGIFLQGLLAGVAGVLAGALLLFVRGNTEFREVASALHRRFWKQEVVLPEPEHL